MNLYQKAARENAINMNSKPVSEIIAELKQLAKDHDISYSEALSTVAYKNTFTSLNLMTAAIGEIHLEVPQQADNSEILNKILSELTCKYSSSIHKRFDEVEDSVYQVAVDESLLGEHLAACL